MTIENPLTPNLWTQVRLLALDDAREPKEHLATFWERVALSNPTQVALRTLDGSLEVTYGGLLASARHVAIALIDAGMKSEELVAHMMERSAEAVAGLLGVVLGGGAYVPLDPSYPPLRLNQMIESAQVNLAVVLPDSEIAVWLLSGAPVDR